MRVKDLNGKVIDLSNIDTNDLVEELRERDDCDKAMKGISSGDMVGEIIERGEEDEVIGMFDDEVLIQYMENTVYCYSSYDQKRIIKQCDTEAVEDVADDWNLTADADDVLNDMEEGDLLSHVIESNGTTLGPRTSLVDLWLDSKLKELREEVTSFKYLDVVK